MLVLHYTGMETADAAIDRLCDPTAKVSAHHVVCEDGRVLQLVDEGRRAWHAGVATWQGDGDLNSRSIGVEIVNGGHDFPDADGCLPDYPAAQISAVITLCRDILSRHKIRPSRIVGHSDIAPSRKRDPGEHFPWAALAAAGIGVWPEAKPTHGQVWGAGLGPRDSGSPVLNLKDELARIGYDVTPGPEYDASLAAAVSAFQRRWQPLSVSGVANPTTLARIVQVREALDLADQGSV